MKSHQFISVDRRLFMFGGQISETGVVINNNWIYHAITEEFEEMQSLN